MEVPLPGPSIRHWDCTSTGGRTTSLLDVAVPVARVQLIHFDNAHADDSASDVWLPFRGSLGVQFVFRPIALKDSGRADRDQTGIRRDNSVGTLPSTM